MSTPTSTPVNPVPAALTPQSKPIPSGENLGVLPVFVAPPALIRLAITAAGLAACLLAAGAIFFALTAKPEPLWALAGVQALTLLGGLFAVVWSRNRPSSGPVLALLCAAGAVLTGAGLGMIAYAGPLGPTSFKWWALAEIVCALSVAGGALLAAIARHPDAKNPFFKGSLLAIPAIGLAVIVVFGSRLGVSGLLDSLPTFARLGIFFVVGLSASIALCVAAHHLSIAFGLAHRSGRVQA
jgi:hypothetical protein